MDNMIMIQDLHKRYGKKKVLNGVDLEVRTGEILGFIGPNGAGKTTTIKILVGLLQSDHGKTFINHYGIEDEKSYKKSFGYVADNPFLYESLTGLEYITFLSQLWEVSYSEQDIFNLLGRFQLKEVYDKRIAEYSFGMKKKLAIIGALVHQPKCLILDEPLNGLDPTSAFMAKHFLKEYIDQGNTVFLSTHTLEIAEKLCHRVALLKDGYIYNCDTVENLTQNQSIDLESYYMDVTQS